jgi:general secretion pathway protein G
MMNLPPDLKPVGTAHERLEARRRIEQAAERLRRQQSLGDALAEHRPLVVTFFLVLMIVVGAAVVSRLGVGPAARQTRQHRSPHSIAVKELGALRIALERFQIDCGRYPTAAEGLTALVQDPGVAAWAGPYVNLVKPDPWRQRYGYRAATGGIVVFSRGPDRTAGTADDLVAAEPGRTEVHANWKQNESRD